MKKAFVFAALLASTGVADPQPSSSASSAIMAEFDTRTRGAAVLPAEETLDSRGLTWDVSGEILLNTKIPLATLILLR